MGDSVTRTQACGTSITFGPASSLFLFFFLNAPPTPKFSPLPQPAPLPICEDLRRWPATTSRAAAELSDRLLARGRARLLHDSLLGAAGRPADPGGCALRGRAGDFPAAGDRKSTRLNSSHGYISYAVFCLTQ